MVVVKWDISIDSVHTVWIEERKNLHMSLRTLGPRVKEDLHIVVDEAMGARPVPKPKLARRPVMSSALRHRPRCMLLPDRRPLLPHRL